jgi:hypothetical protein
MSKWFGKDWGAPICAQTDHVDTPVGDKCAWCEEVIVEGDQGTLIPHGWVATEGEPAYDKVNYSAWHIDCFMRSVVGSVGHQKGTCHCHGGTEEDPEGMTRREAATAAVRLYHRNNPGVARQQRAIREGNHGNSTSEATPRPEDG